MFAALIFGLAAAICWGGADFVGGIAARRSGALVVAAYAQLTGLVAVGLIVIVAHPQMPDLVALLPALIGGLAGGLGLVALYQALRLAPMGLTTSIASCGLGLPILVSFVMGETPNIYQGLGLGLVAVGVIVASYDSQYGEHRDMKPGKGIMYALLAAFLFGLFYIGLDAGGDHQVLWTVLAARVLSVAMLLALMVSGKHRS